MADFFDIGEVRAERERLRSRGDGGHDGGMPPDAERIAKLETHIEHMKGSIDRLDKTVEAIRARIDVDFRLTWGGMIIATLGLAALMAKGFHWI